MCERCEALEDAMRRIVQWAEAYPTNIFHEPSAEEAQRARQLLSANGMTLDAFSASMGRHCLKGVGDIARGALKAGTSVDEADPFDEFDRPEGKRERYT